MLPSLATKRPRRSPTVSVSGPKLLPAKKAEARQVFATKEMWAELTEAAEFHEDVFEALASDEKVSRNTIVVAFLGWALEEYWADKGGKPGSKAEWAEKVKRHAQALREEQAKADAPKSK
jgi:hypothetical protein